MFFLSGNGNEEVQKFQVPTTLSAGYVLLLFNTARPRPHMALDGKT
jgi:hypothetical protein